MTDPKDPGHTGSANPDAISGDTLIKDIDPGAFSRAKITNRQEASRHAARNTALADAKYRAAVEAVMREGKASTALIMREVGVDFNQAARIVDQMEDGGLISLPDHKGKRVVHYDKL